MHAYCICIEPLRWGWGRSRKCASHVTQRKCDGVLLSGNCSEEDCFIVFMWFYQKLFGFDTHPDGIYMKLYQKKKIKSCTRIVCIEPVRLGWGRSGNCASHVTQRKCDGVLFSGNCSEGIVSSFPCGFIRIYLALIPIRTAFIWSYIIKKFQILHAYTYCMYRAGKVGVG